MDGVSTLTYTGAPVNMYFKSIVSDQTTDAYVLGTDYQVRYFEDTNNDGVLNAGDERLDGANGGAEWGKVPPVAVGNYFIVAMDNAAWANFAEELNTDGAAIDATDKFLTDNVQKDYGVICQYFKVVPQDFSGVSVYEVNPLNDEDTSDTTFVYNGKAIVANVSLGGADLHYGTDYTVSCGGVALAQVAGGFQLPINKSGATQAGTYDLVVTPHGAYTNYGQAKLTVTVGKLDLSEADVFAGDRQYDSFDSGKWYDSVSINGTDFAELMDEVNLVQYQYTDRQGDQFGIGDIGYLDLDVQENVNPGDGTAAIGGYDYTVKANPRSKNVNGETTVTIDVVTDLVDEAFYGSEYFADALDGETFYGDVWAFDASAIKLAEGGAPYTGKFTTTVTDANGTEVEAVANAGRYTVTVEVVPAADNYATGGTFRASFTYFRGQVDTASVEAVATIDGANVPFGTIYGDDEPAPNGRVYDGTAVEPKITVKAGDATLAEGTDYTVTYKNAQGEAVESMVDAGVYTVEIKLSNEYVFANNGNQVHWFGVEIQKRAFESIACQTNATDPADRDKPGVLYTGSDIDPVLVGTYKGTDGDTYSVVLDPSWYQISGITYKAAGAERYTDVESISQPGEYRFFVTPTAACSNYTWWGGDGSVRPIVDLKVIELASFTDVSSTAWYADEVALAKSLRYVNGMGNNMFFRTPT